MGDSGSVSGRGPQLARSEPLSLLRRGLYLVLCSFESPCLPPQVLLPALDSDRAYRSRPTL